ncbi:MAG: hypothetical protein N2558_01825 [Patescibacteria group bacterium]|nr:hypothetical protein [Patescibacteria group bacterium]
MPNYEQQPGQVPLTEKVPGLKELDCKFASLEDIVNEPVVLMFSDDQREVMRRALELSGALVSIDNVDDGDAGDVYDKIISDLQWLEGERVLSEERFRKIEDFVKNLEFSESRSQEKDGNLRSEGLRKLVVILLGIALGETDEEIGIFVDRLNQSLWKSARLEIERLFGEREEDLQTALQDLDELFKDAGVPRPDDQTPFIDPKLVEVVWLVMTGREPEESE